MDRIINTCMFFLIYVIFPHTCMASDSNEGRPSAHLCPIMYTVMQDPVIAADGHSYEREAITKWLTNKTISPITNADLSNTNLIDNIALRTLIKDWKPSKHDKSLPIDSKQAYVITECVRAEFELNKDLLHSSKDKHIVVCLGKKGAGKSTLINLLTGKKLITSSDEEEYILKHPNDAAAMVIGSNNNLETFYPKHIDIGDLRFFEFPDFNNTDGSERKLINTAFMSQIFLEAASVRLVLVAEQDQFTTDRSASVKQMFYTLKSLCICAEQTRSLMDEAVFVVTKATSHKADIITSLLKKVDSADKEDLNSQFQSWDNQETLFRMMHPAKQSDPSRIRKKILERIRKISPVTVKDFNASVMYSPVTLCAVESMLGSVVQEIFNNYLRIPMNTAADYESALVCYKREDFWQWFDRNACEDDKAMSLLKRSYANFYRKVLVFFENENEGKRQAHINDLEKKKQQILNNISVDNLNFRDANAVLVPGKNHNTDNSYVSFNFGYHPEIYDMVNEKNPLVQLATDNVNQMFISNDYALRMRHRNDQTIGGWLQSSIKDEESDKNKHLSQRVSHLEALLREKNSLTTSNIVVPEIAQGHEDIYRRFYNGKLIYKPDANSNVGRIELPIKDLENPLDGVFDISECGDTDKYLSIATGYRTGRKSENANKVEIWVLPHFLISKNINKNAAYFENIMKDWNAEEAPIGIFWTAGSWSQNNWFDYLTTQSIGSLSGSGNLHHKWQISKKCYINNRGNRLIPNVSSQSAKFLFRF
jgi:hypothetical protein